MQWISEFSQIHVRRGYAFKDSKSEGPLVSQLSLAHSIYFSIPI